MTTSIQTLLESSTPTSALSGKVALVTGAAKGLGAAITMDLARQGADIVLSARDEDALRQHADHLDAEFDHRSSLVVRADVLSEDDVQQIVNQTVDRFGGIDILVNTAGGTGPIETPAQNVEVQAFREILELNVLGTFIVCKYAIPSMIERRDGRIVTYPAPAVCAGISTGPDTPRRNGRFGA